MLNVAIALALVVIVACYMHLLFYPAVTTFSRVWERLGAAVLTLYILAVLLAVGVCLGLLVVYSYDRLA